MRIAFVFEDNANSANMNIALRIAKELKKNNNIIAIYWFSENVHDKQTEKIFDSYYKVGYYDDILFDKLKKYGWQTKSRIDKLKLLLSKPALGARYFLKTINNRIALKKSKRKIECIISKNDIDWVLGVVEPHVIAKVISELNVKIKKGIIQLDPYSSNPYTPAKKKNIRKKEEKRIIQKIDLLFTTDLIINDLRNDLMIDEKKMIEIFFPLITKQEEFKPLKKRNIINKKPDNIYFLHAGTFLEKIRNPKVLVDIFEKLPQNYILVVAGRSSEMIKKYDINIENRVICLGMLSHDDISELKNEVDFLISFNNNIENMVPSKLFECINSCKPFISISQIYNCPTIKYIKEYSYAHIIMTDSINEHSIRQFEKFVDSKKGKYNSREDMVKAYSFATVEAVAGTISENIKKYMNEDSNFYEGYI